MTSISRRALVTTALIGSATLAWPRLSVAAGVASPSRIVSIGGSLTEIVFALGAGDRLVARDTTSTYPPEALKLPDTGYIRALSPEGVLSVNPDLILVLEGAGPPEALSVLQQAGIPLTTVPDGYDRQAIVGKVHAVGKAIGEQEKAEALASRLDADLAAAETAAKAVSVRKKVLFVLSLQNGRVMAAGANSHADAIITMAGGKNAMADVSGYKPVSDEAILAAAPDLILMMTGAGDHAAGDEQVLAQPAIAETPAGKAKRIIRMDGMFLLGFGPRTPDAIRDLHSALYKPAT
ncbi:heme/hemin ABC transporter substrate-binding protein [Rhizobium sp. PAMB 3182]